MTIVIQRRGSSESGLRVEDASATLHWGVLPDTAKRGSIKVSFALPVAGGGTSEMVLSISPEHFDELASMMMLVAPRTATEAFERAVERKAA